jgi:hypothetical protein
LARLLPCDPRVASSIEEVAKASDARIATLIADRKAVSEKSQQQIEALKQLLADHTPLTEKWKAAQAILEQETADVRSQSAYMSDVASKTAAPVPALKSLEGIAQTTQEEGTLAGRTQTDWTGLTTSISDWILASQGRQNALELEMKALETEGQNWRAYYAARTARAKAECNVMNPGGDSKAKRTKQTKRSSKSKTTK